MNENTPVEPGPLVAESSDAQPVAMKSVTGN